MQFFYFRQPNFLNSFFNIASRHISG